MAKRAKSAHKRIALGADHAGFALKESLREYCRKKGIDVLDVGTFSKESVDYPLIGKKIAEVMLAEKISGVFLGGSGFGECMAGNKIAGIRAARCASVEDAVITRRHNDANMLNLGGRMMKGAEAKKILDAFLTTPFDGDPNSKEDGERHVRRIKMLHEMDGYPYP
ncbi:MAG TPA: RpiB/LacA/LacB family sugar-phosphate isomerase [Candidatus Peribacterales bacterium]|nr:RpiB/LacA/LacB family sugar-phosphate isomerase [Candidatus Peribacterales bacterium]